eukprot:CAMPEP_0118685856 /NCGR_PEP_ID=MMETSP0800-20121206/7484_1 /TAXON_ID=210618 ORGANISM="Striatella unipunctata, Strain CCMP2910" /NCGR_SAMPLE_ID=MMETSP0800 /ASSEMBLY_ACC=CAM_ASM_000638 /LENGTH=390 /DNA_ID=CAMNT_0006582825 /DNA_START=39 /DNA_END=1211 /DNA_ORIENTATION=-
MSRKAKFQTVRISTSGMFLPTKRVQVYSSQTMTILAGEGRVFHPKHSIYEDETYLVGFHLDQNQAIPAALGSVPGCIPNSFSLDHYDKYVRVATSSRAQWKSVAKVDPKTKKTTYSQVQVAEATNQLYVLSLPNTSAGSKGKIYMEKIGSLKGIGHKGKQIYAVRFLNKAAFVVTNKTTDPFYTIDLSNPAKPTVVGELKISGYSNYLHPIDDDQSQVMAIGQEADPDTGRPIGLQISVFDVSTLKNPKLLTKYLVENGYSSKSYSIAQWEHKAFRYLKESNILIVPVSLQSNYKSKNNNFDGFWTFHISPTQISHGYTISHMSATEMANYCWYPALLPPRSFVFNGNVMTMKSHSVLSHSLTDGKKHWELNLDQGNTLQCDKYFSLGTK